MRLSVLSFLTVCGCVSAHKEKVSNQTGSTIDRQIQVSVEKNERMSSANFVVLEYTLENKGADFRRYKNIELIVPEKLSESVKVVVGQDLVNWAEGIKNKMELEAYNRRMILASISAVAMTGAALSKDPNFSKISAGVGLVGAGAITVSDFQAIRDRVRDSGKYDVRGLIPDNHILAAPVSLPPNLFLKRFGVFYIPKDKVDQFHEMKLKLNGDDNTLNLVFDTKFAPRPLGSKCVAGSPAIRFRKMNIRCVADCERVHPFNRQNCKEAYLKKYPE